MPDDQMRGLKDLLSEEAAPVDATAPIARPAGTQRGLSVLLTDPPPAEAKSPIGDASPVARPAAPHPPASHARQPAALREPPLSARSADAGVAASPRRKTSVTLPPRVRERVADAYHRGRWTLLALLVLCGDRLDERRITRDDIERVIADPVHDGGASAIRSLTVPSSLLEQFDQLADQWRLSRSSLIAACLVLVLDNLPE